jgi:hypothetical protein
VRRHPREQRGQPADQPVELLPEGRDDHLLRGRHRAGHARTRRPRRRRQGEEPRVTHRCALRDREDLRRTRRR